MSLLLGETWNHHTRAGLLIRSLFLRAANGKGINSLQTAKTDCG
jgi:hypothetical protein